MAIYHHRDVDRTVRLHGVAPHSILPSIPLVLLGAAVAADLAFWATGLSAWASAAMWLIGGAVLAGVLKSVGCLTDALSQDGPIHVRRAWSQFAGNIAAVLLALADFYVRYFAGAPAAVPAGLVLTLVVIGCLLLIGGNDGELSERPPGARRRRASFRAAMRDDTASAFDRRRADHRRAA
jgi:uncharacterized membrane protein